MSRLRRREEGWLIVEVMISALVLVIAALAILNGLDGAQKASGRNRNRSEAAAIAQQDQERLRSFESSGLSNYHSTRQVTFGNLKYVVTSRAQWVRDTSGTVSCTLDSSQAQYLLITSTVTDPTGANAPITAQSLVAPHVGDFSNNTGTAAIQLVDRNGNGDSGIPVSLAEPPSPSDTTNSAGCVVFGFLPIPSPGPYHAVFSKTGYVDTLGNNAIGPNTSTDTGAATLVQGQTSLTQFQYDLAGSMAVNFDTKLPNGTVIPSTAFDASIGQTGLPGTHIRRFTALSSPAGSMSLTNIFPFTSSYTVWAGSCSSEDPPSGQTPQSGTVSPGGNTSVAVHLPPVNITVKQGTSAVQNARVFVTATPCGENYPTFQQTSASGALPNPGFPYGTFTICADDVLINGTANPHKVSATFNNNVSGGITVPTMTIPGTNSTSGKGKCGP
jgi:type II secretory pathway pseudopilin PulG